MIKTILVDATGDDRQTVRFEIVAKLAGRYDAQATVVGHFER